MVKNRTDHDKQLLTAARGDAQKAMQDRIADIRMASLKGNPYLG